MLRRLLAVLLTVLLACAVVLIVPLAGTVADSATRTVYTDRLGDADRFASLASRALADGRADAIGDELRRYTDVYGIRAWLLALDGSVLAAGDSGTMPDAVRHAPQVDLAQRGVVPEPPEPMTPFDRGDLLVAVPVGSGSESIGAVVTLSPGGPLRQRVVTGWALLVGVAALVTGGLALATVPFSRWLLRPVARLDTAAAHIAAGRLASRVGLEHGPPELRRLVRSFDRMADVVEQTHHRQQQFVGDASHQLRTPLTSLSLALDNLGAMLPPDDADARAEHAEAVAEVRAMGRMFDGLLVLTRIGAEEPTVEQVDETVAGARVGWASRCASAGLALAVDVVPGLAVRAPAGGLRHVLDELVENACRLSGGSRVAVAAHPSDATGDVVEVSVTDDGRGLDAAGRAAAVRRFWRAPDAQNTAGSGLGLAIVAGVAEASGGHLELRDAQPGLAVVLTLHAARPRDTAPG